MIRKLNQFVTAKLRGVDECRQGCVISVEPFRIVGVSGQEYDCEGSGHVVENPPDECVGCERPLGSLCFHCAEIFQALTACMRENGQAFTQLDITEAQP